MLKNTLLVLHSLSNAYYILYKTYYAFIIYNSTTQVWGSLHNRGIGNMLTNGNNKMHTWLKYICQPYICTILPFVCIKSLHKWISPSTKSTLSICTLTKDKCLECYGIMMSCSSSIYSICIWVFHCPHCALANSRLWKIYYDANL